MCAVIDPHDEPALFTPIEDPRPRDGVWPDMAWPVPAAIRLHGRAVVLTPTDVESEAAQLYAALDHDQVWAHVDGRPASAAELAEQLWALQERSDWQSWTVRMAGLNGPIVGTSSYLEVAPHDARLEIGRTLYTPRVWGGAVNAESKLLLLGHCFEGLDAGRVQLKTDVRNVRSQQAIARLGARYEGTLRRHKRRGDGTHRDSVLFSITAEEWPDVRRGLTKRLGRLR